MAAYIHIDIQGSRQSRDAAGRFEQIVDGAAAILLKESAEEVQGVARAFAPVDLGGLQKSIVVRAVSVGGNFVSYAVETKRPYAMVQEEGRDAGQTPPSTRHISGWANRHGFGTKRAKFLLAKRIGANGFKGRHYMKKAADMAPGIAQKKLARVSAEITKTWFNTYKSPWAGE